ncbi:MAG: maleylpyruvate isomerase N-terminal domain-containing protein [Ilumatobacteraceae bacterium]
MLHDPAALTHEATLAAFEEASDAFLATLRAIVDWEAPGIGEWTVRELAGHTLRAYTTIETYLDGPPIIDADVASPSAYFRTALATPGVHDAVAQRGRDAAVGLDDPVGVAETTAARVIELIRSVDPAHVVESLAGRMSFTDYLVTRVVELTIHTTDLQVAAAFPVFIPATAAGVVLTTIVAMSDPATIVRALTGRGTVHVLG